MKLGVLSITLLAVALAAGLTSATLLRAADTPAAPKADTGAPKAEAVTPKVDKKADAAPKGPKLDGPVGKLDLTDAQKADILKLRSDLKAELKKEQEAEKTAELALLTPDQKTQLAALEEAAQKAAAEKKAAAATQKSSKDSPKDAPKDTVKTPKPGSTDPKLP